MKSHISKSSDSKGPVQLLPFSILYGKRKNDNEQYCNRFYEPPTNCSDLTRLGYTFNGYYLVKPTNAETAIANNKNGENIKLQAVFCACYLTKFLLATR